MAIDLSDCAAVVVTRGDQDLSEIEQSLAPFEEVAVWDNSAGDDLAVYGRYAALAEIESDVVYVQDDDVVLPLESLEALAAAYEPGVLTANMPARFRHDFYVDHCLVGFGAIFDRELPREAFRIFSFNSHGAWVVAMNKDGKDISLSGTVPGSWERVCDIAFTGLTPRKLVDVPYRDLPWADTPERMWRQPGHAAERTRMLELVRQVRDAG